MPLKWDWGGFRKGKKEGAARLIYEVLPLALTGRLHAASILKHCAVLPWRDK